MRFLAALALLAVSACTTTAPTLPPPARALEQGWSELALDVTPAALSETEALGARYGALIYRGGIELKSPNPMFGGWSGIEVDDSGRFVAVSDKGAFMTGALTLNAAGDLVGVSDAKIGLMRTTSGNPVEGSKEYDAEDIARLPDGRYAVSFEQTHRIDIYDIDGKGPIAAAQAGPPTPQDMGSNEGMEALALTDDGDLIAGREFGADRGRITQLFRVSLKGDPVIVGTAEMTPNFALVSLRRLPDGDYLAMERFYLPVIGNKTLLARFSGAAMKAKAPHAVTEKIALLEKPMNLDNFEGLAVTQLGRVTRLYIISDNNFTPGNKTLIYAFDLAG